MSQSKPQNAYWYTTQLPNAGGHVAKDINTTVAIIGGGVAGLSCAQRFHEAGIDVVLIEKDFCGAGASGQSAGFITPPSEIELTALIHSHGEEKAKRLWEFALRGVKHIRENIKKYDIDCDYQQQDSVFAANNESGWKFVQDEHAAREKFGYTSTLYNANDLIDILGSSHYAGAVRYSDTFGMNAYRYCLALRDILRQQGVTIYENTSVQSIDDHTIVTPHGTVTANRIITCTDRHIPELGILTKEIYHVQTFLAVTEPLLPEHIAALFPTGPLMVWDTSLVYNYFRITGDHRLLFGGGDLISMYQHHQSTHLNHFTQHVYSYLAEKFPNIPFKIHSQWAGMLGVSKDLLPILGPDTTSPHITYLGAATGLPWATALGAYAAEQSINNAHDLDADFSPERHFVIGPRLQSILSTPVTYAISNGITEYL